jgi:hypothetical protein
MHVHIHQACITYGMYSVLVATRRPSATCDEPRRLPMFRSTALHPVRSNPIYRARRRSAGAHPRTAWAAADGGGASLGSCTTTMARRAALASCARTTAWHACSSWHGGTVGCRAADGHGMTRLTGHRAVPGPRHQHGDTIRHGTAKLPCLVTEPEIMDREAGPKKLWTGGRSKEFQP